MHIVLGTCHHDCPDTCGWQATVEDGRVVKLRGNKDHPYSQGELCPKVNRFVDREYHPDRILHPLIRTGPKGAGEFRQATWDEAIALTVQQVSEARDAFGGESIYPWHSAGTQGLIQESSMDRALFARLQSSRQTDSVCGVAAGVGMAGTYGGAGLGADPLNLEHSDFVILWATNTKLTNRHLWPTVEKARANGARIVCIDPVRTMTAEASDWFIQPVPGTDVALMLAMMHVLVAEDLIDHEYVRDHALGWDELAEHVAQWTPERAGAICGLPAEEIRELALAYGRADAPFIRTLIGAEHHENGGMFFRTAACLPVLTGAWRKLGGGIARSCGTWQEKSDVRLDAFETPHLTDGAPRRGLSQNHLGRNLTNAELGPPIKALFVWCGNPVVTLPNSAEIRRGLERDDLFTVVSEQFMTDTALYADVVFPAATQLEQYDVVPAWGHLWLGWNEKAVEPLGEAVPNTELWRRLAAGFGFTDPEFSRTDLELIEMGLDGVDIDEMRATGFVRINGTENLMPYANGGFDTASGKAELVNTALASRGLSALPDYRPAIESMAHVAAADSAYPLHLTTPKQHTRFMNSTYSAHEGHGDREGSPWVELDVSDATQRGLADGDMAVVFNDRARLELPVRISKRLRPGMVAVPWGWWASQHPDGQTANALTNDTIGDFGVGVAYGDTLVQVTPA